MFPLHKTLSKNHIPPHPYYPEKAPATALYTEIFCNLFPSRKVIAGKKCPFFWGGLTFFQIFRTPPRGKRIS
jgi:hypothetical protein